jgi:hypothetical protein
LAICPKVMLCNVNAAFHVCEFPMLPFYSVIPCELTVTQKMPVPYISESIAIAISQRVTAAQCSQLCRAGLVFSMSAVG